MIKVSFLARAAIGLAVILLGLGWMTFNHETARSSGREVVLQTNPVDPRDVFFGHYATLRYRDFNDTDMRLTWPVEQGLETGDVVYFSLATSGPFHQPRASFATLEEAAAEGVPLLKAELFSTRGYVEETTEAFFARFDLPHQYFSDPETALALQTEFQVANAMQRQRDTWEECTALHERSPEEFEQSWRCEDINLADEPTADIPEYGVILSVSDTGEAVIKGLYLDGQRLYDSLTGPRFTLDHSD